MTIECNIKVFFNIDNQNTRSKINNSIFIIFENNVTLNQNL